MATHSSVLAWRIPGMAEPGGLHRVRHNWSNLAAAAAAAYNQRNRGHRKILCPGAPQGPSQYQYSITKYIYTQSHVTDMKPLTHTPQSCDLREQAFPQGVVFLVDSGLCGAHVAHPQFLGKKKKTETWNLSQVTNKEPGMAWPGSPAQVSVPTFVSLHWSSGSGATPGAPHQEKQSRVALG